MKRKKFNENRNKVGKMGRRLRVKIGKIIRTEQKGKINGNGEK